jgi:hypothetical protein
MLIQGQVGPISTSYSVAPGVQAPIRQGNMGDQIITQYAGKYSELTYRRQMFCISNQGGVTHSAALTTTFVGICIGNPQYSTVNMHVMAFWYINMVALAAMSDVGIMTGVGTITGALTPRNRYVGGPVGQGLATGGMTLPGTPVLEHILGAVGSTLVITSWEPGTVNYFELGGSLILPPNTFAASYMLTASGAAGFQGGFLWAELPI